MALMGIIMKYGLVDLDKCEIPYSRQSRSGEWTRFATQRIVMAT